MRTRRNIYQFHECSRHCRSHEQLQALKHYIVHDINVRGNIL